MRLSGKEKNILSAVELRADLSVPEIAEITGYQDYSIRYFMQQMRKQGIICFTPCINLFSLGCAEYVLFFSVKKNEDVSGIEGLFDLVPEVSSIVKFLGGFDYAVTFHVQQTHRLPALLKKIAACVGNCLSIELLSLRISITDFNRRYLTPNKKDIRSISRRMTDNAVEIDEIDARILYSFLQYSFRSKQRLARKIGLAPSTLEFRINRLQQRNIITGWTYRLAAEKLGLQTHRLLIALRGLCPAFAKDFFNHCATNIHVVQIAECIGSWNFEITVEVQEQCNLDSLLKDLHEHFAGRIRAVRSLAELSNRADFTGLLGDQQRTSILVA
jgi:Lrp/AsnC family transcriptional regulator, leucine-responsive regulatory protein